MLEKLLEYHDLEETRDGVQSCLFIVNEQEQRRACTRFQEQSASAAG